MHAEPVLIVPAWIMKYYILDLTAGQFAGALAGGAGPHGLHGLLEEPDASDRDISLDDYRAQGVMAALDAVSPIVPGRRVHACGYCLGGTMLAIAAATMARDDDDAARQPSRCSRRRPISPRPAS